jgi:hypothetical protein
MCLDKRRTANALCRAKRCRAAFAVRGGGKRFLVFFAVRFLAFAVDVGCTSNVMFA